MVNPDPTGNSGRQSIKVINAALDEIKIKGESAIVLRGVVDPDSLRLVQVADYQRETLNDAKIRRLMEAVKTSRVPDIDLGMRGERCFERNGSFYLQDPVFVVDGLQRITASLRAMAADSDLRVHLGAMVNFGTTVEWERSRFEDLNLGQTKLSPNVTLRNQRTQYHSAELLCRLASSEGISSFPLRDRITWSQSARRGELIAATTFFGVAGILHSHIGPGRSTNVIELCGGLDKIIARLGDEGSQVFVQNVVTFFDVIDKCWGVRQVAYREGAVYLRASFMRALALLFTKHVNFWREDRLFVDTATLKKLTSFPVQDPSVRSLSSSSGMATEMLFHMLTDHVNKGRRTGHLKRRDSVVVSLESINDEAE